MRRILPESRMGLFAAILIIVWLLKSILLTPRALTALSPAQQLSLNLLSILLVIPAIFYSWKLFSQIRRKLLWKIRRRLILANTFIGIIPILLVVVILNVAGLLLYYQLINYLISNHLKSRTAEIHAFNLSLREGLQEAMKGQAVNLAYLKSLVERDAKYLLGTFPSAGIILRVVDPKTDQSIVYDFKHSNREPPQGYQVPRWVGTRSFSGLVVEDSQPEIYRMEQRPALGKEKKHLFLRSLVFGDIGSKSPFSLEISVPLDRHMLDGMKAALGSDLLLVEDVPSSGLNGILLSPELLQQNVLSATFDLESNQQLLDKPVWSILLFPISWNAGTDLSSAASDVLFVEISVATLFHNVFRSESNAGKTILGVLQLVIGFFLIVEIISVVIGLLLTKSITSAVFSLDRGTEFLRRGDFSHRIVVKSDDQLGALAKSFNQMTEYIQDLIKERAQKERLERELEIAKEVQEQSFPRHLPQMERLDFSGICLPARIVSGDYYDFLPLDAKRMGMALGDICGKGISAALLMANLQATLRSNVLNFSQQPIRDSEQGENDRTVSQVVRLLSQQIYHYTAANKFASFFYAVYDDTGPAFSYCNAGHNPPLFFNGNDVQRLVTGGTVIGIFPDANYEQDTIALHSGDLIVAYTDGIVESVNEYGEEFGEERLIALIEQNRDHAAAEIQKAIIDRVLSWAFVEEQDDDMTMCILKVR